MAEGNPAQAASLLEEKANQPGKDQVLFLLDYALAQHQTGNFKESNEAFIEVDRLAEWKDYVSLSQEVGSLFLNDSLIAYKSERFENLLINAYLALNFTLENNFESALVECRRIDEKLNMMRLEGENKRKNFYARYLSAMIWEAQGNWDSAYIDYTNAFKIDQPAYLYRDLIRSAWLARRHNSLRKWRNEWPDHDFTKIKSDMKNRGELVFLYQQGWVPKKRPRPGARRFPMLVRQSSNYQYAQVEINGQRLPRTERLYDVGGEAIRTLEADYGYLIRKRIIGIVAKEVVADQIRQRDKALGAIAAIGMHLADQADVRQWSTLPNSIQISKTFLPPGKHEVAIYAQGSAGEKEIFRGEVTIQKGKKTFITQRTF